MAGRQTKVLHDQADLYGFPLRGPSIDLPAFVRFFHDWLARNKNVLRAVGEDPMSGPPSPALEKWRELEQKSPPRSRRWFLAKYWVARLHFEQGNRTQAAKIITLLQLLHPELGGPELKPQFEELLSRCRE